MRRGGSAASPKRAGVTVKTAPLVTSTTANRAAHPGAVHRSRGELPIAPIEREESIDAVVKAVPKHSIRTIGGGHDVGALRRALMFHPLLRGLLSREVDAETTLWHPLVYTTSYHQVSVLEWYPDIDPMPPDRDRDKVHPAEATDGNGKPQMELWDLAEEADPKAEGFPGTVRLLRHRRGRAEPGGGAARVGNAPKSVCDGTRKGRNGRGGDCRRLGASGDSAAARRGIEQSLRARADQLAEDPGFAGGHARLETAGANNGEAEGNGTPKGVREYLALLSISETCKYKGISFLDFLRSGEINLEAFAAAHDRQRKLLAKPGDRRRVAPFPTPIE